MTTLSLVLYHPLLRKQILLATMHCESENKENSETFWNLWNEALSSGLEERYMLNPAGLMLDEKGSNWNAIKNVFGCEFMERCISCEFDFKQSLNRKMKDSMFTNSEDREKFRNLTRNMLEAQTEIQFKTAVTNLESFITEKKERNSLSEWLKWWLARKEHIFRDFKDRECPESNLSEVMYSSCVTTKLTHMTLYEATIDDIAEHVTIRQMLKAYGDGGFGGGAGPNFKTRKHEN